VVGVGAQYGYIDTKGQMVVQPQFDLAWDFYQGSAFVKLNNKYGFVDKEGIVIWCSVE
ncbi:WG repeat-containing protein, partial [Sphingobacteriales bacterium CHB3]|nr:WG repeat-containing protein [Sphingobacteriales bacterium CHB3]